MEISITMKPGAMIIVLLRLHIEKSFSEILLCLIILPFLNLFR